MFERALRRAQRPGLQQVLRQAWRLWPVWWPQAFWQPALQLVWPLVWRLQVLQRA